VLLSIMKFGICGVKMETRCHLKIVIFFSSSKRGLTNKLARDLLLFYGIDKVVHIKDKAKR